MKHTLITASMLLLTCLTSAVSLTQRLFAQEPDSAASFTYSDSAVIGTYSLMLYGNESSGQTDVAQFIGSFKADGKGKITAGTFHQYWWPKGSCTGTFTGTYSMGTNAAGIVTLNLSSTEKDCGADPQWHELGEFQFRIQLGQQGQTMLLVESDSSTAHLIGTAVKQ